MRINGEPYPLGVHAYLFRSHNGENQKELKNGNLGGLRREMVRECLCVCVGGGGGVLVCGASDTGTRLNTITLAELSPCTSTGLCP